MTFQCTLNTRLKKIVVVAANFKQYSPFSYLSQSLIGKYFVARLTCQNVWWHLLIGIMTKMMDLRGRK